MYRVKALSQSDRIWAILCSPVKVEYQDKYKTEVRISACTNLDSLNQSFPFKQESIFGHISIPNPTYRPMMLHVYSTNDFFACTELECWYYELYFWTFGNVLSVWEAWVFSHSFLSIFPLLLFKLEWFGFVGLIVSLWYFFVWFDGL